MLDKTLLYLVAESSDHHVSKHSNENHLQHFAHMDTTTKLGLLQDLLCVRPPSTLPGELHQNIESIILRQRSHRLLTDSSTLTPSRILRRHGAADVRVKLWQGDITTLTGVQAITNAANSQMLGCFQPTHRCIDNVFHSRAGPGLREECHRLMEDRGSHVQPGQVIVSHGHCLPCPFVIHAVGPQLDRGKKPTQSQRKQLAQCYKSVLQAAELLSAHGNGNKAIAFCCISTGLFAFPALEAAEIAVAAVLDWLQHHPETSITDVIFNTFVESDTQIYQKLLQSPGSSVSSPRQKPTLHADSLKLARDWLHDADTILVTAGAGLSAAEGLDYTSQALFRQKFPGFLRYGLKSLYSVFGFDGWSSGNDQWGYYFTHLNMIAKWPQTSNRVYQDLVARLKGYGDNVHVRTSNADGFFLANGWSEEQLSTPQGSYSVLQCFKRCREDAFISSAPLVAAALPYLDPVTQSLTDSSKIPGCRFCGGKMFICVRGGSWFNTTPFKKGENIWKAWKSRVLDEKRNVVILELGAGFNTPGVLRWPNEDLVAEGGGRVRLVRVGLGLEAGVPWEQEDEKMSTSIEGDIKEIVPLLLR